MNNNEEMTVPKKLYHYTSKNGFLGIIENKTLWASGILYMNDEKEAYIPLENLFEILEEDKNVDIKERFEQIKNDFLDFYKAFIGFETYVISFSEKKDDLNMWRAYGDNASGICFEFNSESLLNALRKNQKQNQIELSLEKCIYDKQEQKNKIQSLLDSAKEDNALDASLFEKLLVFSTYFKHESFKDEQEWRIIVKLYTAPENKKLKRIRLGKNVFVPYCELRIEQEKLPRESEGEYPWLEKVIVGSNTTDLFNKSVVQACFVNGIGFGKVVKRDLLKSGIPYRG